MKLFSKFPFYHTLLGFGVSLLFLSLNTACSKVEEAKPATTASTNDVLQGDWALIKLSGGFAGLNEDYTLDDSPRTISFELDNSTLLSIDKNDSTSVVFSVAVQDVTSSNDTVFFSFSPVRGSDEYFFLAGRPLYLIDNRILETELVCCDYFDYRFIKK